MGVGLSVIRQGRDKASEVSVRLGSASIGRLVHETCDFEDTGPE